MMLDRAYRIAVHCSNGDLLSYNADNYIQSGFHLENFIRGGSSVIIMKGGHDQMKSRCGFCSKLGYCEGVVEEFGGKLES